MKLPEEPSPVPAGMSAKVVISICNGPKSNCLRALPNDRMLNLIDRLDMLDLRIFEVDARSKRLNHRHVDKLVDRRRYQEIRHARGSRREIGTASAKGDTQRTTDDDHNRTRRKFAR